MHHATLARSVRLLRAFRREQSDPAHFYGLLAADTVAHVASYARLRDALVLDVGAGSGSFLQEFAAAGARCVGLDLAKDFGAPGTALLLGDAQALPVRGGAVDVCFSSNVLEHVPDPWRMAGEMVRVTRPGGLVYLAFTNWLSPWGGHETSPWHLLGGHYAVRRYTARHGVPPKNRYGEGLFPVSVRDALHWAESQEGVTVEAALPRYHPAWARWVVRVPGLREIATWNLVLVLRKH
jgi:SAM-dependent methyltransferase